MILTCPSCGTQYVVKDGAIPPQGRQVRCASCKHSWHQGPEDGEASETEAPMASAPADTSAPIVEEEQPETISEATMIEPRSGPEAEERAYEEAAVEDYSAPADMAEEPAVGGGLGDVDRRSETDTMSEAGEFGALDQRTATDEAVAPADWNEPPEPEAAGDEFSPFPVYEEEAPRRRSGLVTLLIILIVVAALAAAFWFLAPPQWKAMLGLSDAASPLALVTTHMDRQRLESGNELLTVTGRVINPTGSAQTVPPLQAQLKTRAGKTVYRWTIAPPARTLPAGASASFNSAEVNVPPGGDELTISLGTQKG